MIWIVMTLGTAAAGAIQTITGFGSVVVMMLMFPFFFNMVDSPSLALAINTSTAVCCAGNIAGASTSKQPCGPRSPILRWALL